MVVGQGGTPLGSSDITACVESATRYHLWTIREAGGRGHAHPPPTDSFVSNWLAGWLLRPGPHVAAHRQSYGTPFRLNRES